MRRAKRQLLLGFAGSVACLASALAHAPYERVHGTFTTGGGGQLQLVLSYVDGIIGTDPVSVVLRKPGGQVIAQTEFLPAVVVICPSLQRCRVFEYDPPDTVLPVRILRVRESGFEPEVSRWLCLVGAALPLWEHGVELVIACVALAAVPLAFQFLILQRRSRVIVAAWIIFALGSIPWLGFWLLGIGLNLPVASVWVFLGALLLTVAPVLARAFLRRGLTKRWS